MVRVHPGGGFRLQHRLEGAEAIANIVHVHRPAGIHHVNTGGAVGFHLQRLLRQLFREVIWLIIRKPTVSMPSSRAKAICCAETSASVQWVATRTTRAPA